MQPLTTAGNRRYTKLPPEFEIPDKLSDAQYVQPVYDPNFDTQSGKDLGSYKISKAIIERMMSKKLYVNDEECSNITPSEMILLLSLPSYSSNSGLIKDFSVKEGLQYMEPGCMCEKSVYNALEGLNKKGYILLSKSRTGLFDIVIIDNDFSDKASYKKGYLNTNRDCFVPGMKKHKLFLDLPLGARKIYLLLSMNYQINRGWFRKVDELQDKLGIKDRCLIYKYLDMLSELIDDNIADKKKFSFNKSHKGLSTDQRIQAGKNMWTKYKEKQKQNACPTVLPDSSSVSEKTRYWHIKRKTGRSRIPVILVKTGINTLGAKSGIEPDQISYSKRMFANFIRQYHIEYSSRTQCGLLSKNEELNFLFVTLASYQNSLGYEYVKNTILHMLIIYGNILSANYWAASFLDLQYKKYKKSAK